MHHQAPPSLEHVLVNLNVTNDEDISNRYIFHHDLGSGAYATVKRGYCTTEKSTVAIKIILKTKMPKEYLKKFVPREIDALGRLSKLNHPYVTHMKEVFETPNRIFIVLGLATGGDLLTYINARRFLKEDLAKRLCTQILFALDHIHDLGIVHRDLKCENLLLDNKDNIILSDFGFATQQPQDKLLSTFCGSYAYAAPEILTGSSYNGKATDVWSLGIIMYAMLNGRLPFNDCRPKKILLKIKTQPLLMVRQVSLMCEHYIKKILCVAPEERPTAADLLLDIFLSKNIDLVLETLPEHLYPTFLRKSDSFDYMYSTEINKKPIQLIKTDSINTERSSSTISEKVKRKYRQLKTWASKKRKLPGNTNSNGRVCDKKKAPVESSTHKSHAYVILDHNVAKCVVKAEGDKSNAFSRRTKRSSSALPGHSGKELETESSFQRSKSCKPENPTKSSTSSSMNTNSESSRRLSDASNVQDLTTLSGYRQELEHKMRARRKLVQKGYGDKKSPTEVVDNVRIDSKYVAAKRHSSQSKKPNQFRLTASISRYSIEPSFTDVLNTASGSARALPPLGQRTKTRQASASGDDEIRRVRRQRIRSILGEHQDVERKQRSTLNEKAALYHKTKSLANSSHHNESRATYDESTRRNNDKSSSSESQRSVKIKVELEKKKDPVTLTLPPKVHYVDVFPSANNNIKGRERGEKDFRVSTIQVGLRMTGSGSGARFNGITKVNT